MIYLLKMKMNQLRCTFETISMLLSRLTRTMFLHGESKNTHDIGHSFIILPNVGRFSKDDRYVFFSSLAIAFSREIKQRILLQKCTKQYNI